MQADFRYSSPFPDDTPPLSPSCSPPEGLASRSTVASSPSSLIIAELGNKMSGAALESPIAQEWDSPAESVSKSASYSHPDMSLQHLRATEGIKGELSNGLSKEQEGAHRGRPGYHDRPPDRLQGIDHPRPVMERQSSYSKRHSSFNTRREMPYPQGHLGSSLSPRSYAAKDLQDRSSHTPAVPFPSELSDSTPAPPETSYHVSIPNVSQNQGDMSPEIPDFERMSAHSLPIPDTMPYSALPAISHAPDPSAKYTNFPPELSARSSSETIPTASISRSSQNALFRQSPSPPLLADDDFDMNTPPYAPAPYPNRLSEPLPPRAALQHAAVLARPTSFPYASTNNMTRSSVHGCTNLPPPQPPTISTPPPPLSGGANRKPAPHEPFLSHRQPSSDQTYIAVETLNTEYILVVRLPGFQRDAM